MWPDWSDDWIVHVDEDIVVIDKPAGLACHAGAADQRGDALIRVAIHLEAELSSAHGLDREASGLVVYARSKRARRSLAEQFARGVARRYVVALSQPFQSKQPRTRSLGRGALGELVELSWDARSQPVRRWLRDRGRTIVGDDDGGAPAHRLLLHVSRLELEHPAGRRMTFERAAPSAFADWVGGREPALGPAMREAAQRRYPLRRTCNAMRLVNGAGDGLPDGLTLDAYGDHLVLSLHDDASDELRESALDAADALGFVGVYLKLRPRRANTLVETRRAEVAPGRVLRGDDAPASTTVREEHTHYRVHLADGLSTGIFLDQRVGRQWVCQLAGGARVLNLFAYHGAFNVAAAAAGAAMSLAIDSSKAAVRAANDNLAEYGGTHQAICAEVLSWCQSHTEQFDLVILDPPSFSTVKGKRFRAARDYRTLASAALSRLAPGGRLLASTNHRGIVRKNFRRWLELAASDAGHTVRAMDDLPDPIDFPPPHGQPCHLTSVLVHI